MARRTSVGLDIGSHGVYVAEISNTRRGTVLTNFGGLALPDVAVEDGEVVDVDAVAETIRALFDAAGIRGKRVHVGIGSPRVVVRQVDVSDIEEGEVAPALRARLEEHIPVPVDAELDYQEVGELASGNGIHMRRVLLVAADRESVAALMKATSRAGLRPMAVDLAALATLRCALLDPASAAEMQMIVAVGSRVTSILVHDRGVPRSVRLLVLVADDVMLADELACAIRGSLGYHRASPGSSEVERVLVTGGGSKLPGLVSRLEEALDVPVDPVRPLDHLEVVDTDHGREDLAAVEPVLVTAIGLALGGAGAGGARVDLLPSEYRRRERERRIRTVAAATGLALLLVPAALYVLRSARGRWNTGAGGDRGKPRAWQRRPVTAP